MCSRNVQKEINFIIRLETFEWNSTSGMLAVEYGTTFVCRSPGSVIESGIIGTSIT